MAKATGKVRQKREHILKGKGKPLGKKWHKIVGDAVLKESAKRVRTHVKVQNQAPSGDIVIRMPATFLVRFSRKGKRIARNGSVDCFCIITEDACICYGPCPNFPECCDEGPIFTKG